MGRRCRITSVPVKRAAAYLSGLAKLETIDKRIVVSGIGIPVVSNMFSGKIRFKAAGSNSETADLLCEDGNGDACGRLTLELPGLKLVAVNVLLSRDSAARETTIKPGPEWHYREISWWAGMGECFQSLGVNRYILAFIE